MPDTKRLVRIGDNWIDRSTIVAVLVHEGGPGARDGYSTPCVTVDRGSAWEPIFIPCPDADQAREVAEEIATAVNHEG